MARFAVAQVRPMIARLGIAAGSLCLAWIMAGSGLAGAQPWQPRDPEPPPDLPAVTGLTRADEAAMRVLIEAQIAAMRADDWPSAFALSRRIAASSALAACLTVIRPQFRKSVGGNRSRKKHRIAATWAGWRSCSAIAIHFRHGDSPVTSRL